MKKMLLVLGFFSFGAAAQSFDWMHVSLSGESEYNMKLIKDNAVVKAYAKSLGGKSWRVTEGKSGNLLYAVETNNGCAFDVEVSYVPAWPTRKISVTENAVCN